MLFTFKIYLIDSQIKLELFFSNKMTARDRIQWPLEPRQVFSLKIMICFPFLTRFLKFLPCLTCVVHFSDSVGEERVRLFYDKLNWYQLNVTTLWALCVCVSGTLDRENAAEYGGVLFAYSTKGSFWMKTLMDFQVRNDDVRTLSLSSIISNNGYICKILVQLNDNYC